MQRQIILDTETTGLSPQKGHRIIEIGCLEMINRRLTNNHFHYYLNPLRAIDRAAEEVHGINNDFLEDKPLFKDIIDELIEYLRDAELIIHNAPFDVGFLNHEFRLAGLSQTIEDICIVTDTLSMARRKHPGQHNSLDALCRRYSVDNSNRDLHGALLDSELLAQVYLAMTGGQTQLFQSLEENHFTEKQAIPHNPLKSNRKPLPVIFAKQSELLAHETYLKNMRAQGKCLWEEN